MGFMNIHFNLVNLSPFISLRDHFVSALSVQQRKVLAIAALAFGCLAICYAVVRCCYFKAEPLNDKQDSIVLLGDEEKEERVEHDDRKKIVVEDTQVKSSDCEVIVKYFDNFEALAKGEKWKEILSQGTVALEAAQKADRKRDEAKINAQLTSTSFYLGDYQQAIQYAKRCHELAEEFEEPSLFLRALYLESAVYRALAPKIGDEEKEQAYYALAVKIAQDALDTYNRRNVDDSNLMGKILFNLGAAHADNPKGNLKDAVYCYSSAFDYFEMAHAEDDMIRTQIRLGKVCLLQGHFDMAQNAVDEARLKISNERLTMHADYLEAQIKFALNEFDTALKIATAGIDRAIKLGAKEDEARLRALIEKIEKADPSLVAKLK